MIVIVELAADSRGTIQSASSGYKPTRQSSRNDSSAPGYKRADRIQFGKSIVVISKGCGLIWERRHDEKNWEIRGADN